MKIDLLMPMRSNFEVLHHMTRQLGKALERQGHICRYLSEQERFECTLAQPPDLMIGIAGAVQNKHEQLWCDIVKRPYVVILVDPPLFTPEVRPSPYLIVTCDERCYATASSSQQFPYVTFLPMAIESDFPLQEYPKGRPYEVTFLATYFPCEERLIYWQERYGQLLCDIMNTACELFFVDSHISIETAINKALKIFFTQEQAGTLPVFPISEIFIEIERVLKARLRIAIIKAIKDATVHLFTPKTMWYQWQQALQGQENVIFHDAVSFVQSFALMQQSKIVLSSSIKREGVQERTLYGLACGAAVLANRNVFLEEAFEDNVSIALYRINEPEKINEQVNALLAEESKRCKLAACGRELVMRNHTWDVRAESLMSYCRSLPLFDNANSVV